LVVLINPAIAATSEARVRDLEPAVYAMGFQIRAVAASTNQARHQRRLCIVRERLD